MAFRTSFYSGLSIISIISILFGMRSWPQLAPFTVPTAKY